MAGTISRDELKQKINRGDDFYLVDANRNGDYLRSHLPGAMNIPADDISALAPQMIVDKHASIVVYGRDQKCSRPERSAKALESLGYQNVREFHDGREGWLASGLPVHGNFENRLAAQK
jgi:rhodanese-related sulfurtransferase